jgi:hypothetical protein
MDILLFKLLLTPVLIAALTLIGRRWGPAVSGAVAGLPLTSSPVSVFLALEQGRDFAAHAAIGTLAGLIAVGAFCLGYALTAQLKGWLVSALAGIGAFFILSVLLLFLDLALVATFVSVVLFLVTIFWLMPKQNGGEPRPNTPHPKWDLALRIGIATTLVFLLTAIAPRLGSHATGLISPFPVFGGVLAIFAHRHFGPAEAQRVLRSVVVASFAFAVFFLIVGVLLERSGLFLVYSLAGVAALITNAILFTRLTRKP